MHLQKKKLYCVKDLPNEAALSYYLFWFIAVFDYKFSHCTANIMGLEKLNVMWGKLVGKYEN